MSTSDVSLDARSLKKKHRLVSKPAGSRVDESLFGPPARLQQMTGNRGWNESAAGGWWAGASSSSLSTADNRRKAKGRPEVVEVITKDLVRKLKVPSTPDPSGMSVIIDENDLDRIRLNACVLSMEERKKLEEEQKHQRQQRMEESNTRKKTMNELELTRKQHEKPSDLEQEEAEVNAQLVSRAKRMVEEQDDEIKKVNELVLHAKCNAIRDAQNVEKEEILKAMKEEEARLDLMMEVERQRAIEMYEEREKKQHLQRLKGAQLIQQQIRDNETQRVLDAEKKQQETQAMLKYLERLQQEDWDKLVKKREAQRALKEEVDKCNTELHEQKCQQRERMKMEDLKIMEYLKDKERREEEHQKELERIKAEKELEVARLRAQQERAKDKQAERDALRAKRNQEEFEREWRRKEKETARKKADTEEMLRNARAEQVRNKEHFLAVQAHRDRTEFERVLGVQRERMEADEQAQRLAALQRRAHAAEIREQVQQKEQETIESRRQYFEEGIKLDQEAKERRRRLDAIKQRKLAELRAAGIPEKYCAEVSRKITAPPTSFIT